MKIAIYCSSREDIDPQYIKSAEKIGAWIGSHAATMIYGGMNFGLMKVAATAVKSNGGRVVGVVPVTRKLDSSALNDETIIATDLNDRKAKIIMFSDVFVVLPGGYGSLDEFIATFASLSFVGNQSKTIILLNQNGLYDPTLQQFRLMIENKMMDPTLLQRVNVVATAQECCEMLELLWLNRK